MASGHLLENGQWTGRRQVQRQLTSIGQRQGAQIFDQPAEMPGFVLQNIIRLGIAGQLFVGQGFGIAGDYR